eukprot:TRINITY_DN41582_c0_g1_i1.p1 TRINITY_DN41582_c0_g1~~TRINITY_DN41582_c0_g1_i1.p1  ORF type:complete len:550 (-),score=93.46 TRINITY_DN41582_c0_g1_i1:385-2034(-)
MPHAFTAGRGQATAASAILAYAACCPRAVAEPLLLSPLIEAGKLEEARDASRIEIDGQFLGHSGYFSVDSASGKNTNQMFTWFQPCHDGCDPATAPLIQWFNGGPGSPDTIGAMNQIGNWYVDKGHNLHERCFSWCKKNNCLFVDSPVMTGFSYQVDKQSGKYSPKDIEYTKTSKQTGEQILALLLQFFKVFPEYKEAPYYVHGLSYGGHYVPWMGRVVLDYNKDASERINLKGIAAGDPAVDNKYQYPTFADTFYAMGLVMEEEREEIAAIMANATHWNDRDCWESFSLWNNVFNDDGGSSCQPNCEFRFKAYTGSSNTEHLLLGSQPETFDYFRSWLPRHAAAFHFEGQPNTNTSLGEGGEIYLAMVRSGDFCESTAHLYTSMFLNDGIDVMIYSSNMDVLLGPPTAAAAIRSAWDFAEKNVEGGADARRAYYAAPKSIWRVAHDDVEPAGYSKCLELQDRRFCYVIVRNAGHETAPYAPRAAHDLSERFMHRLPFGEHGSAPHVPQCHACGGAPPLAGPSLPACHGPSGGSRELVSVVESLKVLYS